MAEDREPGQVDRRGLRWYVTVLRQEFPALAALNLVFLLTCLPVVTLGPALSALGHVLGRMVNGRSGGGLRAYFAAFRKDFPRKLGWGLLFLLAVALLTFSARFYGELGGVFLALSGFCLATLICLAAVAVHLFPALSGPEPPEKPLRSAGLAALLDFRRTMLSLLAAVCLMIPHFLLFPQFLPLTLVCGAVLPGLALAFPQIEEAGEE